MRIREELITQTLDASSARVLQFHSRIYEIVSQVDVPRRPVELEGTLTRILLVYGACDPQAAVGAQQYHQRHTRRQDKQPSHLAR